jgi:hypothetical protein
VLSKIEIYFISDFKIYLYICGFKFFSMKLVSYLFFSICLLSLCGCAKIESHAGKLEVTFVNLSFEVVQTASDPEEKAILKFDFLDGDGKVGARSGNNDRSRIHYEWYSKYHDDKFLLHFNKLDEEGDSTFVTGSYPIPYNEVMDRDEANNPTLRGSISIQLLLSHLYDDPKMIGVDSMRIKYWITDRNGKESNEDYTPIFSVRDSIGNISVPKEIIKK